MKYALILYLAILIVLSSCGNDEQHNSSTSDSSSAQASVGQDRIVFPLKTGDKLHYRGTLITDSSNDYPTDKPFSEKEYNKEFVINDLVLIVDTVINVDDYTFVRFLFNANQPALDSSEADLNFIVSSEPGLAFNLLFYKKEIYTVEPAMAIYNLQVGIQGSPGDSINKYKIDTGLYGIYNRFYKEDIIAGGCLQKMLHNRVLLSNGVDSMHIIGNGEGCNFNLDPFINTSSTKSYSGKGPFFGSLFLDFLKHDSLPGEYGGRVKVYGSAGTGFYVNDATEYYYSDKYFINKITRNLKWNRTMHGQLRGSPPTKYSLTLYKIDGENF